MIQDLSKNIQIEYKALIDSLHGRMLCKCNRIRQKAMDSFLRNGFPTKKHEDWRYNDLSFLDTQEYRLASTLENTELPEKILAKIKVYKDLFDTIVVVNGRYSEEYSKLTKGSPYSVFSFDFGLNAKASEIEPYIFEYADYNINVFSAINAAIARDGVVIKIPDNKELPNPICIININFSDGEAVFSNNRNKIIAGRNSIAKIIGVDISAGTGISNIVNDFFIGDFAYIDYYHLQIDDNESYIIDNTNVNHGKNAVFNKVVITTGGKFIRNNDYILMKNDAAELNMNGLFMPSTNEFIDNHTFIKHQAQNCTTVENYKGVIDNNGIGVFNGKVLVDQDAQKTNATQTNKNILLSDDSIIYTKPELEIYADDVKCNHGSATGNINEAQLYYLKSRGISDESARALLLFGFAKEVVASLKNEDIQRIVTEQITKKLNYKFD
jgi:Fe-S cluster assembly protein SufD